MPNPSELERQSETGFNPRMQDMTADIHNKLKGALSTVLEDFLDSYEPITYDSEFAEVEHEHFSGFVPFTDGGFHTLVLYRADHDSAYCPSLFDDYIEALTAICERDFYEEQTGEYPESDVELRAYFDKLLDSESGLDEDKELYYEFEHEYFAEACPGLEIKVLGS